MKSLWGSTKFDNLDEKIVKKKIPKANVWDLFKAVTQNKNVDNINYNQRDLRMLLIFMSYNIELVSYSRYAEHWLSTFGAKHVIKILEHIIPKKYYKINYKKIKNIKDMEIINHIKEYFNVSEKQALEYINILDKQDKMDEVKDFFFEGVEK